MKIILFHDQVLVIDISGWNGFVFMGDVLNEDIIAGSVVTAGF